MKFKILHLTIIFLILILTGCSFTRMLEFNLKGNTAIRKEIDKQLKFRLKQEDGDLRNLKEYKQVFYLLYSSENFEVMGKQRCDYMAQLRSYKQLNIDLNRYIKEKENLIPREVKTDKRRMFFILENSIFIALAKKYCPFVLKTFGNLKENDMRTEIDQRLKLEVNYIKGDLEKHQEIFNLLYRFKNFEQIGREYCDYFEQLQSKQRYINDVNKDIKEKEKYLSTITIDVTTDQEKILRTIERSIAMASVEVHCPSQEDKLFKQLKIFN